MLPIWRMLAQHGTDVVLAAHDHLYERFAPMNAGLGFTAAEYASSSWAPEELRCMTSSASDPRARFVSRAGVC